MRSLVVPAFAILLFSFGVHGQACGRYRIFVKVSDTAAHAIKNADVKLSAITTDETHGNQFVRDTSDSSSFVVSFTEGQSFMSFHKVTVSAPGFDPAELKAMFVSCGGRTIEVQLQKAGSNAKPVFHFENQLSVEADDADGNWIKGVGLKITKADTSEIVVDQKLDDGYLFQRLPNGNYLIEFKNDKGEVRTAAVDLTALHDQSVKLKF